jgi:threonine/homoserine/homoserine lactone efflux protein
VLFVFGRSLGLGRAAGIATVVGNTAGEYVQVLAVAFGIGAIAERSVLAFTVVKLAGAAYLVYLGVQAIRHRRSLIAALAAPVQRKSLGRVAADGLFVGATNPKTVVFLAAILPQFIDRSAGNVPVQVLLLGAIFSCLALICDSAWALAAGTARAWLARSPRRPTADGRATRRAILRRRAAFVLPRPLVHLMINYRVRLPCPKCSTRLSAILVARKVNGIVK